MDSVEIDYKSLVSQADIYYSGPAEERYQGMPIGNGVTGSMVWTQPDRMQFQINRVDVFATNSATASADPDMNSHDYLGGKEYCGGCAFLDIAVGSSVFTEQDTTQHLKVYDGQLELCGKKIEAQVKVWTDQDVFCIDITDDRVEQQDLQITFSMLRDPLVVRSGHTASSKVFVKGEKIGLSQEFFEKCSTGISENDHYCASAVLANAVGCKVLDIQETERSICLSVVPNGKAYSIYISSGASMSSFDQALESAEDALDAALLTGKEEIDRTHAVWWHDYWHKSYIDTPCDPNYALYWYTYLYYIGSTMRGDYPAKFNGLLFNCSGDKRDWGGQFWWYNQSRSHYGLSAANHGDMNEPLYGMLLRDMLKYQKACEQIWGISTGILFPETEAFNGPEILPEDIAEDLQKVLLRDVPATPKLLEFMNHRSGMNSRWALFGSEKARSEGDALSFRWHGNLSYNAGDVANSLWNYYLYTMDRSVLERIYPWLKGVAEFYRLYPCKRLDEDGYYHFYYLGWAESITYATDVIDDLVMMHGIYKTVLTASKLLGLDEEMRANWVEMDSKIPPYPISNMEDSISNRYHPDGFTTYAVGRKPCRMEWLGNMNDCRLRMVQNFDLVTLETKNHDPEGFAIANHSFEATEVGRKLMAGKVPAFNGYVWNRGLVEAARLGRTDIVRKGLPALLRQFTRPNGFKKYHFPNRLPWTNGEESYSIQELGVFSDQLQEPLLQSIADGAGKTDSVIYVFPAWPREWDVSFEMLAKGSFLVHSRVQRGGIPYVRIKSQKGGLCRLHNPWDKQSVTVQCEDKMVLAAADETLEFNTEAGKTYFLSTKNTGWSEKITAPVRILFDQLKVRLPFYDQIPRIHPGQSTRICCSDSRKVKFVSDDETVLSVLGDVLTGQKIGETIITATVDGQEIAKQLVYVCYPVVNDCDGRIQYEGNWQSRTATRDGSYYDDYHVTAEKGASAQLAFSGCGIEVYGITDIGSSSAALSLDGYTVQTVDCGGTERNTHQLLFRSPTLIKGEHSIKISNLLDREFALDYFRIIT